MTALFAGLFIIAVSREVGPTMFGLILIALGGAWVWLTHREESA
jgi:hypothetical protein